MPEWFPSPITVPLMAAFERHEGYRGLNAPTCETRSSPISSMQCSVPITERRRADGYRTSMELTVALLQSRAASRRCSPEAANPRRRALPPP